MKWLKTLAGLVRMLGMPDTKEAFDELKKVKSTSVGNLLAFMQTFNLRFGPATTRRRRCSTTGFIPILDETRDRIREALGTKPDTATTARANPSDVGEAFSKLTLDQIQGKKKPGAAQAESMSNQAMGGMEPPTSIAHSGRSPSSRPTMCSARPNESVIPAPPTPVIASTPGAGRRVT